MSNIKDVHCKPRLHDLVLAGVWPLCCVTSLSFVVAIGHQHCCCRAPTPTIHSASHVDHEKRVAWLSISMHLCGFVPIVPWYSYGTLFGDPLEPC